MQWLLLLDGDVAPVERGRYLEEALAPVFEQACAAGAHPHRFCDTFAVELLLAGVPLERVSVLLGHSSVKDTEKHYAPWVRDRQVQLEADVRRTWSTDLMLDVAAAERSEERRNHQP